MSPSTKLEAALSESMNEIGMAEGSPALLISWFRQHLSADPALIEALLPGYTLTKRPMTPKERGLIAVPAMNATRRKNRQATLSAALPVVTRARQLKPDADGHEIARELNRAGIPPSTKRTEWTYIDVRRLMKELNLEFEPSKT